jgi:hypothetical protein
MPLMIGVLPLLFLLQDPPSRPGPSRCYSRYNPVALGSEWEYRRENRSRDRDGRSSTTRSESRYRVVVIAADSMRVQYVTGDTAPSGLVTPRTITLDYVCGEDGPVLAPEMLGFGRTTYSGSESPRSSKPGTKWEAITESISDDFTGFRSIRHFEVVGTESVVVPAGRFDALKVVWNDEVMPLPRGKNVDRDSQTLTKAFRWYAPKVGLVRSSVETVSLLKGKEISRKEVVDELVSFRP